MVYGVLAYTFILGTLEKGPTFKTKEAISRVF